jgi:hypothetical protein
MNANLAAFSVARRATENAARLSGFEQGARFEVTQMD